jgi:hypothetical protein
MFQVIALAHYRRQKEIPIRFNVVPLLPYCILAPPFILKNQLKSKTSVLFKFYCDTGTWGGINTFGLKIYPLSFAKPALTSPNTIFPFFEFDIKRNIIIIIFEPFHLRHLIEVSQYLHFITASGIWISLVSPSINGLPLTNNGYFFLPSLA